MYDKVIGHWFQTQQFGVVHDAGCGKSLLPELFVAGHNQRRVKRFVNHREAIVDFVNCNLVQKRFKLCARARSIAFQGTTICEKRRCRHGFDNRDGDVKLQTALQLIYPPQCVCCGTHVETDFGLCGTCWRDTPFIEGLCCDSCGVSLPGQSDEIEVCDDCLKIARPWNKGRAVFLYRENGRKLVLGLKRGDRHEIVRPAAKWLARAARALLKENTLITPVPLHWSRLLRRRFNQSALLANALAAETGKSCCPDLLIRPKRTHRLEGKTLEERFQVLDGAITVHPKRRHRVQGRPVLIVDDVLTSGATLAAAAEACRAAGASEVNVVVLARVAKGD